MQCDILPGKFKHWWRVHSETVWHWLSEQTKPWCTPHNETQPGSSGGKGSGAKETTRATIFPETRLWAETLETTGNCQWGED